MAKRRTGPRRGPKLGHEVSKKTGYSCIVPLWQHDIRRLSAEVRETLAGNTIEDYCLGLTKACISSSSLEPLTIPSSTFSSYISRTHAIESSFWQDPDTCGAQITPIARVKSEVRMAILLLEDIECHGLLGMGELQKAYVENKLDFQRMPLSVL